jgi:hypothetical protein
MPDKLYKPPYAFSVTIGECMTRKMVTFLDLAEKLKMPVEDLIRQCNGKMAPTKALVKGLAKELGMDEASSVDSLMRCGRISAASIFASLRIVDKNLDLKLWTLTLFCGGSTRR